MILETAVVLSEGSNKSQPVLLPFSLGVLLLALPFGFPGWRQEMALVWLTIGSAILACSRGVAPRTFRQIRGPVLLVLLIIAGYLYGSWRISQALDLGLPGCADAVQRSFEFRILSEPEIRLLPEAEGVQARFEALVSLTGDPACPGLRGDHRASDHGASDYRVRLSWFGAPPLEKGQHWSGKGKLRPPWGFRNPAGFDYERWLLGRGLHGTGYVSEALLRSPGSPSAASHLRLRLVRWMEQQTTRNAGLLLALMIGDDSRITPTQWDWLRDSGTIHLLVVSGLHVGIVAGFLYFMGSWLSRLCPWLLLRSGVKRTAVWFAITGSGAYVLLSGFGIPAVRAWLMCSLVLLAGASGRLLPAMRILTLVLFLVLLADPLVVHQQGFWLSFTAVAVLLGYFTPRSAAAAALTAGRHRGWVRSVSIFLQAQIVLLVALSPVLAATQGNLPLVSPIANAIAVPLVSFCILPLVLLVGATAFWLPELARTLLWLADEAMEFVLLTVRLAAATEPRPVQVDGVLEVLVLLLAGLMVQGQAAGWREGLLVGALWIAVLLPDRAAPADGAFRITALDVGQGSAIIVETRHHRLVYDTGPAYPSGFDLGAAAVVPSLLQSRQRRLDALVLSHDDVDHSGGAEAVTGRLTPWQTWASFSRDASHRCRAGVRWQWDGVEFSFLHPGDRRERHDNDRSCVLLVEADGVRALLAGDISRRVEQRLRAPPVTLLFAPHHGSRTSSAPAFVRRLSPEIVFISAARRSRYGHPHPEVRHRYSESGARTYVTGWHGALQWDSDNTSKVRSWRRDESAYWHRKPWE